MNEMYHYLSIRIIENKDSNKKLKRPNDEENREQLEFSFMVVRKVKAGLPLWKTAVSYKVQYTHPMWPSNLTLEYLP